MSKPVNLTLKCVVVGDGAVGKTCMLETYVSGLFPEKYVPTVFENTEKLIEYQNMKIRLCLWDTAGQEDYDQVRRISYPDANIFLVCFSISQPDSLVNVVSKWVSEIDDYCEERVLKVLVGTKLDLREDDETMKKLKENNKRPLSREDGLKVFQDKENGFHAYVECSALKRTKLDEVFETAIEAFVEKGHQFTNIRLKKKSVSNCCLIL